MKFFESLRLALQNIWYSKMRTFLTMLGILIGVTAVIVIVGLGNGMQEYVKTSFSDMGTDTLTVQIMGRGTSRSVSTEELYGIVAENPAVLKAVSPTVGLSGKVKIGTETTARTSVTGVSEDYFSMKDYEISAGRGLQYVDIDGRKNVCIIGNYLNQAYFGGNAVGQSIKVGANRLEIVGVMAQEADAMEEGGTDDCIFLPYSTAARLSGVGNISNYSFTLTDETQAAAGKTLVEGELFEVFADEGAYYVHNMGEMLETMNGMVTVLVTVLAAIAAISLLVGGIGIMNIMLVSVTERTREIGVRKALGAKERTILQQFVIEAATTSSLGGILGILLGLGLSQVATTVIAARLETQIVVAPTVGSVVLAFAISAGIGVLFGFLPAQKAARLNPIDALRYD